MLRVTLTRPDLADPALPARWRRLERHWDVPVFLTWAWVGCVAARRLADPILAEVHDGTDLVGLALFGRSRGRTGAALHLHESGDPDWDAVFIEHNGVLAAQTDQGRVVGAILLEAARRRMRVVLGGVSDAVLEAARAAGGLIDPLQTRFAPYARLDGGTDAYLESLSRNTRWQIRRSDRAYEAWGPITVARAGTVDVAMEWLDSLLRLHVSTWATRGVFSAFVTEPVQVFTRALVREGVESGTVDLLRVTAGERPIGHLMNLRADGRVAAYQSGFDYAGAPQHGKPGFTCHVASVRRAIIEGVSEHDFLAGDAQYKRSLALEARPLHWLCWQPLLSLAGGVALARKALRPVRRLHKAASTRAGNEQEH